jgi:site-specific DNA-methyltransferase (adenine-specific)
VPQFYIFENDVVLDPFAGSETTCLAAVKTERHYICIYINDEYVKISEQRIKEAKKYISLIKFVNENSSSR